MKREPLTPFFLGLVPHAVRLILGAIFIYAGYIKIIHPHDFAAMINNYGILPDGLINVSAIYLPWLEVLAGFALIFAPRYREGASILITLMLLVFTAAILSALYRGLNISCGCFSVDPEASRIGWRKVAENTGLILLSVTAWALSRKHPSNRSRG